MNNDTVTLERALCEQGCLLRPVVGDSMMPLLDQKTDLVKLVPAPHELKLYDLPLYRRPNGALVLHRIIKVRKNDYIICGDNRQDYERVPREWVIALAVGRYRGEQYLSFDDAEYISEIEKLCRSRERFARRFRVAMAKIFPSRAQMQQRYPVLGRAPVLLPFCYIARWGRALSRKLKAGFSKADEKRPYT